MTLPRSERFPIMCLTQDGLAWSHEEQADRLCHAGARWIQLRMKTGSREAQAAIADAVVKICRRHGARCVINDHVDLAVATDAHGVHLGKTDLDWREARERLGATKILGGTVNNDQDAAEATACGVLDYVGVGPWRFTSNKQNLAPILGAEGAARLVAQISPLPAWIIGGVRIEDLVAACATGATGVAVSSSLYRDGKIEENFQALASAWPREARFQSPDATRAVRSAC